MQVVETKYEHGLGDRFSIILAGALSVLSEPTAGGSAGTRETRRNELLHTLLHGLREIKPRLKWRPQPQQPLGRLGTGQARGRRHPR